MDRTSPKRAFVTGATGFIGFHLAKRLIADDWDLHLIVRPTSRTEKITGFLGKASLHVYDGEITQLIDILDKAKPSIVFHLASLFIPQHTPSDVEALVSNNILFPSQLLEAMAQTGCRRLINTGTSWQHFNNSEYNPVNFYAATKEAFEVIARYYEEAHSFTAITLKLYDTYGPGDFRPKLFSLLEKIAKNGSQLSMSPGDQLIDLVHVDDVIEAYVLAAERILSDLVQQSEEYAVSSGNPIRLKELVSIYERVTATKLDILWGGRDYRPREVMVPWTSGKRLPGWHPRVRLEDGMRRLSA